MNFTGPKVGLPPTGQALTVVNANFDRDYYSLRAGSGGGGVENHGVAPHELCFKYENRNRRCKKHRSSYMDPNLPVFSSFNGAQEEDECNISFVGVSQSTVASPFEGNGHLSVITSGLTRIFNTGTKDVRVGDFVYWKFPKTGTWTPVIGMPRDKMYPTIEIVNFDEIKDFDKYSKVKQKFIGTALSAASKGASFDVLVRLGGF